MVLALDSAPTGPDEEMPLEATESPGVELIGALTTCLALSLALATPAQLARLETEVLNLLDSVSADSPSAKVFRSVLRDIEQRSTPQ